MMHFTFTQYTLSLDNFYEIEWVTSYSSMQELTFTVSWRGVPLHDHVYLTFDRLYLFHTVISLPHVCSTP